MIEKTSAFEEAALGISPAAHCIMGIDVKDNGPNIVVVADLPLVKREDIRIEVTPRTITIFAKGEGFSTKRTAHLSTEVSPCEMGTTFKNGTLEVNLEKVK